MLKMMTPVAMLACAGVAVAAPQSGGLPGGTIHVNAPLSIVGDDASTGFDAATRVYDEWTNPPSLLKGILQTGDVEHTDDLNLLPTAVGKTLSTMGFSVANASQTAGRVMTGGVVQITFYDRSTGNMITSASGNTGFTTTLPALSLAQNSSTRLSFAADALTSLGWVFSTNQIDLGLRYVSVTGTGGFTIADAGIQLRDGGTIGSSTDNLTMMLPIFGPTPLSFGGNPWADTAAFIDVQAVPAPGTAALLALGGLMAGRRRRS